MSTTSPDVETSMFNEIIAQNKVRNIENIARTATALLTVARNFAGGKQRQNANLNASQVVLKCFVALIFRQALSTLKIVKIPSRERN